jgi:hypothetical protein
LYLLTTEHRTLRFSKAFSHGVDSFEFSRQPRRKMIQYATIRPHIRLVLLLLRRASSSEGFNGQGAGLHYRMLLTSEPNNEAKNSILQ